MDLRFLRESTLTNEPIHIIYSLIKALVESSQSAVLIVDKRGRIMLANQAFCRLFGISESSEELVGQDQLQYNSRIAALFSDPARFLARVEQLSQNGAAVCAEELPLADGRIIERDYIPVLIDDSAPMSIWQYRNVSEQRNLFKRFQTLERLSCAIEQTADSVVITNRSGLIEYVNAAFESTTGYTWNEVVGNTPRILKSGMQDRNFYRGLWDQVLAGHPFEGTIVNRKKSGELYWSRQTITPMRDDRGNVTHFVSVLKDITGMLKEKEREVEMRIARQVQQKFYGATANLTGFDIAGSALPANETGGDYFDFFPMSDGCLGIAIGDVSDHGIGSALVMSETRAYLRSLATVCSDVGEILTRVNRALAPDMDRGRFVTLTLICLDPRDKSLVYANAGHIPGFLLHDFGKVESTLESTGPPLGALSDYEFRSSPAIQIKAGQILMLVTDGVIESLAPEDIDLGITRAVEYVGSHSQETACCIADHLCRAAVDSVEDQSSRDDVTSVILKVA